MLSLIGERGFVRVGELSETFGVSDVTVRGDLTVLEGTQGIRRVHGGAMPRVTGATHELSFEEALESSAEEKWAIARAAAALVEPGMSVIVDVGSTCLAVARELVRRDELHDVTVITNGLTTAFELENAIPRFQVLVTGGTLRPLQHSLVAPLAAAMFTHVHADLAFIGCNGVDARAGITNINLPEAELKREMVLASTRAVVVADGSKAGQVHLGRIGDLLEFETVFLGASADTAALRELRRTHDRVVTVDA
ncbi:DeoR/GlpR transcriptional regulator [Humibacter ginsenosidimutans]|uniref:DeoR/GlpR transcriptional regulator n=2 Tax=Humibacter ginsenosidimutans TaxID=2599293 RepID=A0A5B8M8F9_9MICO|nr:DeoR/GlpR transcriptional regulator [Humibacter ginsenosidimutans]